MQVLQVDLPNPEPEVQLGKHLQLNVQAAGRSKEKKNPTACGRGLGDRVRKHSITLRHYLLSCVVVVVVVIVVVVVVVTARTTNIRAVTGV